MNKKDVSKEELLSLAEVAEALGYSRQHVLRLVKSGEIQAERVGRSYVVNKKDLPGPLSAMSKKEKQEIDRSVDKVFRHYEETLRKLGKE